MFPFSSEITVNDTLRVNHKLVGETIGPILTDARRARIQEVVRHRCFDIAVVMEGIYDRGNISAVIRTGEGLGFGNFHVIETQEHFKEANRVTQGADKWVEVRKWKTTTESIAELKKQGKQIVVTALNQKSVPLQSIDFSKPTALVLGNEKSGVSDEMLAAADQVVHIPMSGFVQSFNISVAGALCLYQIARDRETRRGRNGDLTEEQMSILSAHYFMNTLDTATDILRDRFGGPLKMA